VTRVLADRVAIVTGAGQGIGAAIARVFAGAGASIVVATRTASTGARTVREIQAAGGTALLAHADVGRLEDVRRVVDTTVTRFGRIDVVVHNAAAFPIHMLADLTEDVLEETLAVNLKAAFRLTQLCLPHLTQSRAGRILFTSSVTGPRTAIPGLGHYAATKAGLNGFIRAAALELSVRGITVNGIEPGLIDTPALRSLGTEAELAAMRANIPVGRFGAPEEVAAAMLFLASDAAAFITGQTIVVDGGALLLENAQHLEMLRNS
jgi:3-oxoacyl-[acyl-carrier protein] reductase